MADGYNIDELRAAGLSEADIAELMGFDIAKYQADYQANQKAAEDARARGLTAAQATGLSDKYVALNDPRANDLIGGDINAQIMGRLGLIPTAYDYAPVFNIKGDQSYENYNFVPVPGKTYQLVDNNTGQVVGTATNATEAKGLAEAANAISKQQGGNANWALQELSSWSDGKGNMTTGYSDVYTNEKTGVMNDLKPLIQAAGIMAMAGAGLAAVTAQAATAAGAGAAAAGSTTGSLVSSASLASSTAANVAAISNAAASAAAANGLSAASTSLLTQVGMGALRGGITTAAFGGDPIEGAVTGGFAALGSTVLGPVIQSVKGAGEVATNLGASLGTAAGTTVGGLTLGYNVKDAFINGLATGAAQYVSTEVAEEIAKRKELAAKEARNAITDQINDKLELYEGVKDAATRNMLAKFDLDEIVVNATKEYGDEIGDWAAKEVGKTFASFTGAATAPGSQAETTGTTTAGIGQLPEDVRNSLAEKIGDIQDDLVATGNSAAGITAANKALNDLFVSAQGQYGDRGSNFVKDYAGRVIGDALTITAGSGSKTDGAGTGPTMAGIGNTDTTVTATVSPTPTSTGTGTSTILVTASPTPTSTGTGTSTILVTASPTPTKTGTGTSTILVTASPTPSATGTGTSTILVTASPTPSRTGTGTSTILVTASPTPSRTGTGTSTILVTASPTPTTTSTSTVTITSTPSGTDPSKWTTKDWIMLGLAVPNLVNRITGKGEDVGTITPDSSRVTFNPLNRQRNAENFDPFTYGQKGIGYQSEEFEFFKPYTTAQPEQKYTPTTVSYTPGADIYEYTPEQFSTMQQNAMTTYNQRTAAFNNFQQTLAKQVESGAMTLAEAQAQARAYAEPFGGAIIQQKADGGYIGYADGGEASDDMIKHLMEYRKGGGHHGPGPVKGIGSGQEDKIPAWLSDGEYVWSAQDVADLGDGSTDEGVRRLDKMRQMVRKQAGRKDVKKIAKPQKGIDHMLKAVGGKV